MSVDRQLAVDLAELDQLAAEDRLVALGLMNEKGLDSLLDVAGSLIRDDPEIGVRLAHLVGECAAAAAAPAALPRATYLSAQAKAAAGELGEALALIDSARSGFDGLGNHVEALRTNLGRAQVLNEMGLHDEAFASCAEILDAASQLGRSTDPAIVELSAAAHQNSGLCLELTGQFEAALEHYAVAALGYRSTGSTRALAEVAYDRGLVLLALGQHAEALGELHSAAETFRAGGYRALLSMALTNTAEVHLHRGEYQPCLDALQEADDALLAISSPVGEHVRLLAAARAYSALNLLPEAYTNFDKVLGFLDNTDLVIEQARARWGLGVVLCKMGQHDRANEVLDEAAARFERSGQSAWLGEVLLDQAHVRATMGDVDAAFALASSAEASAPRGSPSELAARLFTAASVAFENRSATYAEIVRDAEVLSLAPLTAAAYHALGRHLSVVGERDQAVSALRTAVRKSEELRAGLKHELTLTHFLDDKQSPYGDLVDLLIHQGDAAGALAAGEQGKSRTLSDVVRGLVGRSTQLQGDQTDSVNDDLRAIYGELFSGDVAADSHRSALLHHRLRELEAQRRLVELDSTPDSPTHAVTDPTSDASLSPGTVIISFVRSGDLLHAFVVAGESVVVGPRSVEEGTVRVLVDRLRRQWDRFRLGAAVVERHLPQLRRSANAVLAELYDLLMAPLEPLLPAGTEHLVIIPDGAVHDVPFAALFDGSRYLVARYLLSSAPSMTTFTNLPGRRPGRSLVVAIADELAPLVEEEAGVVSERLSDVTSLVGSEASWPAVRSELSGISHFHLAGHAIFRPDNPMYSVIKLADSWVTAADLFGVSLEGATVVLSTCDSARTYNERSTEVNGFVRAFLGAGASTVVASQWSADDNATRAFMETFYDRLVVEPPAAALRSAQMAAASVWPHPYYWAPWIVVGRPGN